MENKVISEMTVKELKAELDKLPETLPISIFDYRMSIHHASDEPTPNGIYNDFKVEQIDFVNNDDMPIRAAILSFKSEDYDDDGEKLY